MFLKTITKSEAKNFLLTQSDKFLGVSEKNTMSIANFLTFEKFLKTESCQIDFFIIFYKESAEEIRTSETTKKVFQKAFESFRQGIYLCEQLKEHQLCTGRP